MKIRTGFVSNSSSSSFCIVGTDNPVAIEKLMRAEGFPFDSEGNVDSDSKNPTICDSHGTVELFEPTKTSKYSWDGKKFNKFEYIGSCWNGLPEYAGFDAEKYLKSKSLEMAKKHFIALCKKKYDIDVPEKSIGLFYGESHSE